MWKLKASCKATMFPLLRGDWAGRGHMVDLPWLFSQDVHYVKAPHLIKRPDFEVSSMTGITRTVKYLSKKILCGT